MSIEALKQQIPDYARDLRINLGNVLDSEQNQMLDPRQIAGVALACALASRNRDLTSRLENEFTETLDESWLRAARAAASIMAMNNIYYRFVHLAGKPEYGRLPAGLRMSVIGNPGIAKVDFELICLAVSAINGCGLCIESHEKHLIEAGVDARSIQAAVRIAAVIHAVAVTLEAETSDRAQSAAA